MPLALLKIQLFSTLFMTGVIWFVQLVHYPSFFLWSHSDLKRSVATTKA